MNSIHPIILYPCIVICAGLLYLGVVNSPAAHQPHLQTSQQKRLAEADKLEEEIGRTIQSVGLRYLDSSEQSIAKFKMALAIRDQELGHQYYNRARDLSRLVEQEQNGGKYKEADTDARRLIAMELKHYGAGSKRIEFYKNLFSKLNQNADKSVPTATSDQQQQVTPNMVPSQQSEPQNINQTGTGPSADEDLKSKDTILHPTLRTLGSHGLEGRSLTSTDYKGLNNLRVNPQMGDEFYQYFKRVETEAAQLLCRQVRGLPRDKVEELAGKPSYKGGRVDCFAFKPNQDIWVYRIGACDIPVRVVFAGNNCSDADICPEADDRNYQAWRADNICKDCKWKTVTAILEKQGAPTAAKDDSGNDTSPLENQLSETLIYETGDQSCAELKIKCGVCLNAIRGCTVRRYGNY